MLIFIYIYIYISCEYFQIESVQGEKKIKF